MFSELLANDCFLQAVQDLLRLLRADSHVFRDRGARVPVDCTERDGRFCAIIRHALYGNDGSACCLLIGLAR